MFAGGVPKCAKIPSAMTCQKKAVTTVALPRAPPWRDPGIKSRGNKMKCRVGLPSSWEVLGAVQDITGDTGRQRFCTLD